MVPGSTMSEVALAAEAPMMTKALKSKATVVTGPAVSKATVKAAETAVFSDVTVTCVRAPGIGIPGGIRVRRAYLYERWLALNNTRRSLARNTLQDCASKLPGHLHLLGSHGQTPLESLGIS